MNIITNANDIKINLKELKEKLNKALHYNNMEDPELPYLVDDVICFEELVAMVETLERLQNKV